MNRSPFGWAAYLPTPAVAVLLVLLTGLGSPASALDCGKARTPVELAICGNDALSKADARLSDLYFGTLRALRGDRHDLLVASQRQWLKHRDDRCSEDIEGCVAASMAERRRVIAACFARTGDPARSVDVSCPYFLHPGCPTLEASGSPGLNAYPFLVARLVDGVKATAGDFDCDPASAGGDVTRNSETDSFTIVSERPGLVCIKIRKESDLAEAAHPNSTERLQCFDPATTRVIDLGTVFPELTAESDDLERIRALADGHLQLGCCDPDDTDEGTLADLNSTSTMPSGWAVDKAGNLVLAFDQDAFGRLFVATATVGRADFFALVAPVYRAFFRPSTG